MLGVRTLAAAIMAFGLLAAAQADTAGRIAFDVYIDDSRVGKHEFVLSREGDSSVVLSKADFEVKMLFITAYRYEHQNREVWKNGCLHSIESRTDSNGEVQSVEGQRTEAGFAVRTDGVRTMLDECVGTFAYWDRGLLDKPRLLNTQTGEHVEVVLRHLGEGHVTVSGVVVPVQRYALTGEGIDITLDYAARSGRWLALESRLASGRTITYRRSNVPLDLLAAAVQGR